MAAISYPFTSTGTLPFGAGTITPTTGNYVNTTYICERFQVRDSLTPITRQNSNGGPNGWFGVKERIVADGVLQLASSNTTTDSMPEVGAQFTRTVRNVSTNFAFTEVSKPEEIRGFWTAPFSALEVA